MIGSENKSGKKRYVVIHGHFYQPPRENPWLDIIEKQDSASPYHDWNERIYDQCYRPNANSRILDSRGMIVDIHNNYSHMSYNFGPTLFRWLEKNHPKIAQNIIAADRESSLRLKKHGNALAQVYNHMIMPLASHRDQLTQIRWAKSFFRKRFKRDPEGFWLAETAINMETVECLIEEGVKFVILSPNQVESFRKIDTSDSWKDVSNGSIDTRRAYRVFHRDRDGNKKNGYLDLFFFDEGLSREISFSDLLSNASTLGTKIRSCFDDSPDDQVVVIATDGETFGHHKPFGDMCLAYFFDSVAQNMDMIPVNFAYFLEKNPPQYEVVLKSEFGEGTAWSCAHGVGRWSRDCGCKAGGPLSWNQSWRAPLRHAFAILQKHVDEAFVNNLSPLISDPWKLRDQFMDLCDLPTIAEFNQTLEKLGLARGLTVTQAMLVRRMCEAQKYMLFAYTSCGWFFSDVSGIETVQNIAYAARALSLAVDAEERDPISAEFMRLLSQAKSNIVPKDGATLFTAHVSGFLRNLSILSFTAIVEKNIASELASRNDFEYFGYKISISNEEQIYSQQGQHFSTYDVAIQNEKIGEDAVLAICITKDDGQIRGWCLRKALTKIQGFDPKRPESFMMHPKSLKLDLSCVFEETKLQLAKYYLEEMSKDTEEKYAKWMDYHISSLDSLSGLGVALPPFVAAPIAYVLTRQWNVALNEIEIYGQEEAVFQKLLDLWNLSKKFGITIDFSESAVMILDLVTAELKLFGETLSTASSERMRFLLNIIDRFSIPFSKNKVEDLFHGILKSTIRPMYDEFKSNHDDSQKEQIIKLLQFARRMNFNTDEFPIS